MRSQHRYSERRICRALGISRSSLRYVPEPRSDEGPLRAAIIGLAAQYGRYGYRQVTGLLWAEGWDISRSRVERIWKQEGLRVPQKQPKRGRLWLADGSCIRLRPQRRNHVWSWDFVMDRTRRHARGNAARHPQAGRHRAGGVLAEEVIAGLILFTIAPATATCWSSARFAISAASARAQRSMLSRRQEVDSSRRNARY